MATKTKIYLTLIALGLVVLIVDRCFIGASAPASTHAGEATPATEDENGESTPAVRQPPAPKQAGPSKLSVPELHFPRNLPAYDPTVDLRDVFSRLVVEEVTTDRTHMGKSGSGKKGSADDAIGREAFQTTHHTEAIMVQENLKIAVVNGRWVRIGDVVDTCTLIRIEGDSTVFQCHDGDAVLSPSGKSRHAPG